jgi:hypothetical protein
MIIGGNSPMDAIIDLGDRFVTSTLKNCEAFWSGDEISREFYSLLAVLHHANANGLLALIDNNEEIWVGVLSYASKIVCNFKIKELTDSIKRFESLITSNITNSKAEALPREVETLRCIQASVGRRGLGWIVLIEDELVKAGDAFVGCSNGELPDKVVEWLKQNASKVAPLVGE